MTFESITSNIVKLTGYISIFIIALALAAFLYGLVSYIINSNSDEKRKESISYIVYGLIGLFVMVSFWGLVYVISNTFGFDTGIPVLQ